MGVRVGVGVGPVRVSGGVSGRDAVGCWTGLIYLAMIAVAIAVAMFVLPPVAVLVCAYMWATRKRAGRTGAQLAVVTLVAAVGVGVAAWTWPSMYASHKYGVDVPASSSSDTVADYQDILAAAGFTHVKVVRVDHPGKGVMPKAVGDCAVDKVTPETGKQADVREQVVVTAACYPFAP